MSIFWLLFDEIDSLFLYQCARIIPMVQKELQKMLAAGIIVATRYLLGILSGKPWLLVQCWNFELLLTFHGEIYKKACFWEIDLCPAVCSDTILILHIDLGTKNQSHQRIINKYSWNGVNRNQNGFLSVYSINNE